MREDNPNKYEIAGEIGDEEEYAEIAPSPLKSALFKMLAALTAAAFLLLVLGNLLQLFTWPSLVFLKQSRELERDPLLQELQQAVVQVLNMSQGQAFNAVVESKGSGFNIHPHGLVVTNRHVVAGADAVAVSFTKGGTYTVSHWVESVHADLALLYLEVNGDGETAGSASLPYLELQWQDLPQMGEEVIIMGNPLGFRRVISRGSVSDYHSYGGCTFPVMEIKAPIHAGSSGSPVFNSEHKVVAVVYASLNREEAGNGKGLALPVACLLELLNPLTGFSP